MNSLTNVPPHPLDSYGQWELLAIAESCNPPQEEPADSDDWCANVPFVAPNGWTVVIFYDCGELDYIDCFVTPEGTCLDVWPDECPERAHWDNGLPPIMNWRGVGDLARLRSFYGI